MYIYTYMSVEQSSFKCDSGLKMLFTIYDTVINPTFNGIKMSRNF